MRRGSLRSFPGAAPLRLRPQNAGNTGEVKSEGPRNGGLARFFRSASTFARLSANTIGECAGATRWNRRSLLPFFAVAFPALRGLALCEITDLVAFDRKHLHQHLIAELQFVADVANAVFGNLADVQEAIGAGEELDEGAELSEPHDLAQICFANLG